MRKLNLLFSMMFACFLAGFSQTATLPISEDFETEPQGPTNCGATVTLVNPTFNNVSTDDIDWSPDAGGTGSFNTGPTAPAVDHSPGTASGKYLYTETSGCALDSAFLESVYMNWSSYGGVQVNFWYHMFGATMGTMHFDIRQGTGAWQYDFIPSWTDNTDLWQLRSISVFDPNYVGMDSVQIRVRGVTGTSFTSDMAIDDVSILPIVGRNLGVLDLVSPQFPFCAGTTSNIEVDVINGGTDTITSFTTYMDINGTIDSNVFAGSLFPGDTILINIGSYTFTGAGPYDVVINTSMPNGLTDEAPGDDTLRIIGARPGLAAGTYTIDSSMAVSATNFQSFSELASALNLYGICGDVVVNVAAGDYNDELLLEDIEGTSPTSRVTINGGDTGMVSLTSQNIATNRTVIGFNGTSYVTVKNMTIVNPSTSTLDNYAIHFRNSSNYDSIVDCRVMINPLATFNQMAIGASSDITNDFAEGDNANHTTIMNCVIEGGDYSVHFEGPALGSWNTNNKFINNTLVGWEDYGFYFDQQDSLELIGNKISGSRTTSTFTGYGIGSFDAMNFRVIGNTIDAPFTGIYFANANVGKNADRAAEIINNMVTAENNHGIWTTRGRWINYFHNSIYCNSAATADAALFLDDGFGTPQIDSVDVRNNVMYAANAAYAFAIDEPDSVFLKFDNNVFEATGTNVFNMDFVQYADLPSFQTAFPLFNANSLEGDPLFAATNNLHIVGSFIDNTGDNSVPVAVDIDGDLRPIAGSTVVDPGADEFDPPLCPPPTALSALDILSDSVTIYWTGGMNTYEYSVVPLGAAVGSSAFGGTTPNDSVGVGGLMPNTTYDYYVREICGRGDTSIWIQGSDFTTQCAPFTASYTNGFEGLAINVNADCWSELNTGYSPNANVWVRNFVGVNGPRSGTQALYIYPFNAFTQGLDTLAAVSPQFSDMTAGDKRVVFWSSVDDVAVQLQVGTMGSLNPGAPVTLLNTVTYNAIDVYQEVIVDLTTANGYNGTDTYIVLMHSLPAVGTFDYIRIDDFVYETIPTCPKPQNLSSSNSTLTSVDLSWTGGMGSFEYELVQPGSAIGTGTRTLVTTNNPTVTGLTPSTTYEYYVREICAVGDTSVWNGPELISTANAVPFVEDFETFTVPTFGNPWPKGWSSTTTVNPRWETEDASGANENSLNTGPLYDNTNPGVVGGIYVYLETSGGAGNVADFVTPPIYVDPTQSSITLEFAYHMFGATMGQLEVLIDTNGVQNVLTTIVGQQQAAQADPFILATANIGGYQGSSIQIIFRGTSGTSFTSDMAIDDVRLFEPTPADASVTDIIRPLSGCGLGSADSVEVEISNVGTAPISNFPVSYILNNGTPVTETYTGIITAGGVVNYVFNSTVNLATAGTYDLDAYTSLAMDGDTTNDSSSTIINSIPIFSGFPYAESFENGNGGWTVGGTTTFALGTPAGATINSASHGSQAWVTNLTGNYNANEAGWVQSPCFDFSTLVAPVVEMDVWWNAEFSWDGAVLQTSIDGGGSWQNVGAFGDPDNWYTDGATASLAGLNSANSQDAWTGRAASTNGSGGWVTAKHSLNGLGGVPGVLLRVAFGSDGSVLDEGFAFDSVRVMEAPGDDIGLLSINTPVSGAYTATTDSLRVTLANLGANNATNVPVNYVLNGGGVITEFITTFNAGDTIVYTFQNTTIPLPGPGGSSTIDVYTSYAPDSVYNNDSIIGYQFENFLKTVPFTEDFEGYPVGFVSTNMPGNWTSTSGTNPRWEIEDASGANENSTGTGPFYDATTFGTAGGNYVYLETSGGVLGDKDTLRSPGILIPASGPALALSYSYHMFGLDMGILEVYIEDGGVLTRYDSINGQQTLAGDSAWTDTTIALPGTHNGNTVNIVFIGTRGNNFTSDMSVDEVSIDLATGVKVLTEETAILSVTPNPSNGLFTLNINTPQKENFNMTVRDVNGKIVYTENLNVNGSYRNDLDFTSFAKGVYYMQVQTETESRVEKLIIQ